MSRFNPAVVAAAAALALPMLASAATVSATLTDVGLHQIVSVRYNNTNYDAISGRLSWVATPNETTPVAFETFCIEFSQDVSFGQTYLFDVVDDIGQAPRPFAFPTGNGGGMGSVTGLLTNRTKDTLVRQLWGEYYGQTHDGMTSMDGLGTYTDSIETAAFQVALWKVLYESSDVVGDQASLASGTFSLNNGGLVGAKAESYLGWLRGNSSAGLADGLLALSNDSAQDQLYFRSLPANMTVVPLPTSVISGGALLGAIAVCRAVRARRK